jgi:UDP-N-acetylmuramate--alanine ligase
MSAIARVLLERGVKISGSDRTANAVTDALARDGACVRTGHKPENINGADLLIVTSAAHENPEIDAAQAAGIPVYKRRDILPALLADKTTLAVAGTHGKTTTSAMLTHILCETGREPGYVVGSVMANTGTNASAGQSELFVIEADEYDDMYLGITPNVAIVTSAEWDHPDFFPTEADMLASFSKFIQRIRPDGILIINTDDWRTRALASARILQPVTTYGFDKRNDVFIHNLRVAKDGRMHFDVYGKTPMPVLKGSMALRVIGRHNAANAVAAALAAESAGVPFEASAKALGYFQSTGRPVEKRGEVGKLVVVDD